MSVRVVGYRVVLPRPWERTPVGDGAEQHVHALVERRTAEWGARLPPDQVGPLRRQLEHRLMKQVAAARRVGGVDVYFPAGDVNGLLAGASFVVSEIGSPAGSQEALDAELVRRELLVDGGTSVELDGTVFVRTESVAPPDPDDPEMDVPSRRVTYVGPRPDDRARWVLVDFSCVGDGDPGSPATAVVVELFDAIMSTWTWTFDDEPFSDPGRPGR